ncbi:Piso0_001842 [Millerozyma farinosa CBS 7064]|uniref:Mitochondrial thiamine pyrophosphate carrier 1 n=1 Tax=Pichia sorbitophila (strain ATCC MYA-4447 / BCRC 22081 / CBS 7064 / NBRC 10061 / NRRL Y-12695) TaxID=559304 RepID=G8YLW0_PICSO|nr:Piso0_001842 [Millerozyma farinosa CBS 7064]
MVSSDENTTGRKDHLSQGASVSVYDSLIAGSISGAVARGITAPLDTLKIRLQLQVHKNVHSGALSTLTSICRNEGIKALWKGNTPAEILYVLYGASQFTTYTVLNEALVNLQKNDPWRASIITPVHSLLVGIGTGSISTFITYPFDFLRTRLAANSSNEFLSMTKTCLKTIREEGFFGLYAGVKPSLISITASTGLMFWTYENARSFSKEKNIPFIEGICGLLAGAVSKGVTFPLDTIRKRLQMYSETKVKHDTSNKMGQLCKIMIRNEGFLSFYKGFGISILKSSPTSAISLFMYEYALDMIVKAENKFSIES